MSSLLYYSGWVLAPVCFMAALGIGRICFPKCFLRDGVLFDLFRTGFGLIVFSLVLYACVLCGTATRPVLWTLAGIAALAAVFETVLFLRDRETIKSILKDHRWPLLALSVYFVFQWSMTLLPPYERDELIYHLFIPKMWLATGGKFFFRDNIYAYFPQLADHYFLLGLGTFGESAARFFQTGWSALLVLALYRLSRKWLGAVEAWLPVFIFLAVPSVLVTMSWAYVDLTFAFYALMALVFFLEFQEGRDPKAWIACALMAGGTAAVKYTGIQFAVLLMCLYLLLNTRREDPKEILLPPVLLAVIAGLILLPYLVRNYLLTGWPLCPFPLTGFQLHSVNWDAERARLFVRWLQTFGTPIGSESAWDTFLAPLRVFFSARFNEHALFEGVIGPVFLSIPFLFWNRKRDPSLRALGLFCVLYLFYWMFTTRQVRFLFPVLPVLSLLLVQGAEVRGKKWVLPLVLFVAFGTGGWGIVEIAKIKPQLFWTGRENREAFLGRVVDVASVYQEADGLLKGTDRLYLLDMKNYGYLLEAPLSGDCVFEHFSLQRFLTKTVRPEEVSRFFAERKATHLLMNREVTFSATLGLEDREAALFRFFLQSRAVPVLTRGPYILFELNREPAA